jgi:hypothetical protein
MPEVILEGGKHKTYLIGVSFADMKTLPQEFVDWDTLYGENNELKHYELPKGMVMVLLLFTIKPNPDSREVLWTTIRRWTPDKETFYLNLIGKEVGICLEG